MTTTNDIIETTAEREKVYTCRVVTITCAERPTMDYGGELEECPCSEVSGRILPGGRLVTYGTASGGGDNLWASIEAYEPNGLAVVVGVQESDEIEVLSLGAIVAADSDNREYGHGSLLTDEEWDARPWPRSYEVSIEGNWSEVEAESEQDALEQARETAREGWDAQDSTHWVDWSLWQKDRDGQDECIARGTATIDPAEPECSHDDGHDWRSPHSLLGGLKENPGVWGKGGGVIVREVCVRCGCERVTDTWAQRPDTGEQGLKSIRFELEKHEIGPDLEAIRWDDEVGKWCGRWFARGCSGSFDSEEAARAALDER